MTTEQKENCLLKLFFIYILLGTFPKSLRYLSQKT